MLHFSLTLHFDDGRLCSQFRHHKILNALLLTTAGIYPGDEMGT